MHGRKLRHILAINYEDEWALAPVFSTYSMPNVSPDAKRAIAAAFMDTVAEACVCEAELCVAAQHGIVPVFDELYGKRRLPVPDVVFDAVFKHNQYPLLDLLLRHGYEAPAAFAARAVIFNQHDLVVVLARHRAPIHKQAIITSSYRITDIKRSSIHAIATTNREYLTGDVRAHLGAEAMRYLREVMCVDVGRAEFLTIAKDSEASVAERVRESGKGSRVAFLRHIVAHNPNGVSYITDGVHFAIDAAHAPMLSTLLTAFPDAIPQALLRCVSSNKPKLVDVTLKCARAECRIIHVRASHPKLTGQPHAYPTLHKRIEATLRFCIKHANERDNTALLDAFEGHLDTRQFM